MKLSLTVIISFSVLILTATPIARSRLVIVDSDQPKNISDQVSLLEDNNSKLSINDVLNSTGHFKLYQAPYVNLGITSSSFWLKVIVVNKTGQPLYVELGNPALDTIEVYEQVPGDEIVVHYMGSWVPFGQRQTEHLKYLSVLHTRNSSPHTFYIRVRHSKGTQFPLMIGTFSAFSKKASQDNLFSGAYYGLILAMIFYNLFIYFSLKDVAYIYYVFYIFFMGLLNAVLMGHAFKFLWPSLPVVNSYTDIIAIFVGFSGILFVIHFLETKNNTPSFHKLFKVLAVLYLVSIVPIATGHPMTGTIIVEMLSLVVILSFFICAIVSIRRGYKPARFFLIAWSFLLLSVVIFIFKDFVIIPYHALTANALPIGSAIEALLLSMALANRINLYKKEKETAHQEAIVALSEKKKLITEQNVTLEKQVALRTREIKDKHDELLTALDSLRHTQAQLIQKEKMASLGELTAGIAHEIQNPLNFINNFSDVTEELVNEIMEATNGTGSVQENNINFDRLDNLKKNIRIINEHGKRAEAIVKNMLQHSQPHKGELEPTGINELIREYLNLSYLGFKTKNGDLSVKLVTQLDPQIGKIELVPQDMARVFLNLFNNAFYSLNEKRNQAVPGYEPELSVTTCLKGQAVEIRIRDNGTGISPAIINKIFQPFYTTKPAGTGTGLGLSLSFDVVAKAHGGQLDVESVPGEFAEFIITLPMQTQRQKTTHT